MYAKTLSVCMYVCMYVYRCNASLFSLANVIRVDIDTLPLLDQFRAEEKAVVIVDKNGHMTKITMQTHTVHSYIHTYIHTYIHRRDRRSSLICTTATVH